MPLSGRQVILVFAIAMVGGAVVAGLIVVGTPARERMRQLDKRRATELAVIHQIIDGYWSKHARLPASLEQLLSRPETSVNTRDPVTSQPYGYTVLGGKTYELCADFQRESSDTVDPHERFWSHGPGRRCFRFEADSNQK